MALSKAPIDSCRALASQRQSAYKKFVQIGNRAAFALAILLILSAAILTRPPKQLDQFDQPFYLTIAYHLIHHGVFSNGSIDPGNGASAAPPPGMFFGPIYPSLIALVARIDARFAKSVDCGAEHYLATKTAGQCDIYVRPMLLLHALLLALGALAVARAAELLFPVGPIFWFTGVLATGALLADADQFSFLMTESAVFCLYSLAMLAIVSGWTSSKHRYFVLGGVGFGALCLARFSYLPAAAIIPVLIVINARWLDALPRARAFVSASAFVLAFLAVILPWAVRNAISIGKFALTEEYGSVTLVERFAYDRMTPREFLLAFPYCLPKIGPSLVRQSFGPDAMRRFQYDLSDSFYAMGVAKRDALTERFTRIDPIILEIAQSELKNNWWRYILVSIPLAWCGMWVGGWLGLAMVPLFAGACVAAFRRSKPLLFLYATPAFVSLALHALLASLYTRYNLGLIGPFSAATAWLILLFLTSTHSQSRLFLASRSGLAFDRAKLTIRARPDDGVF